jgi:MtrB/PioB family decaheme-associated outer membrane protein
MFLATLSSDRPRCPAALFTIAIAGFVVFPDSANAQAVDTSDWVCEFCPFEAGHQGDYDIGAGVVSDDSAYFHNASGLGEEGAVAIIDGEGSYTTDGQQLEWTIEDLGLDSRFAELRGGRQGKYNYKLAYREIPQRKFITTDSIFERSAANMLSLPAGWVRSGSTSGFTELDSSLARRDIESNRTFFDIGGRYLSSGPFSVFANYRHQRHDGTAVLGGASFTTSSLLPVSFTYDTDEVDMGLRYGASSGFLSLAFYLSDFNSGGDSFGWENPFTTNAGAEFSELAQPPDNTFQQVTLSGGYSFDQRRTFLSFSAATGQIDQDALLLPYTTHTSLNSPLPRSSLDGDIETTNVAFSLTSKAIDKTRLKLAYRYDDRNNKTPQDVWSRVITDTFVSGAMEESIPYSFERSSLNLSADYDLLQSLRVSAGYDRKEIDRDFQEVAEQTEDIGWGRLRWRPNSIFDIDVKGGSAKRDIDSYNEGLAITLNQNPLLRKYNLAYRYRKFAELDLSATMPNSPVSLSLSGLYADDSYTQSRLGMISGKDLRFTADLSWAISESASLYITGGVENIESEQLGSESFSSADWLANNDDDFVTYGGGFRVLHMADNFDLNLDYTRSEGTSKIDMTSASGGFSPFPDLETTLDYLRVKLSYQRSERLGVSATLRYQRFVTDDWSLDDVEPATMQQVLTLGANAYDDEILIFGISFNYKVGTGSSAGGTASN